MKVARTGIKRDNRFLYYIKQGAIWASPRKQPGVAAKGKAEKVVSFDAALDYKKYLYFVDAQGDVAAKLKA